MEDVQKEILAEIADSLATEGVYLGVSLAMDTNTVTAVIKTVYNLSGTIGDKVFDSKSLYQEMMSLNLLVQIEECALPFVDAAKSKKLISKMKDDALTEDQQEAKEDTDELAWSFAINAILTLRETGEGLLKKLAGTKTSSVWNKIGSTLNLWSSTGEMNALTKDGAIACAKLKAYRQLLAADQTVTTYDVWTSTEPGKNAMVFNADGIIVGKIISATATSKITDDVALFAELDEDFGSYIKVIIPLVSGLYATFPDYTVGSGSSTGSSSGSSSKGGFSFGSIFSNLFASLGDFFANLFSFFKF